MQVFAKAHIVGFLFSKQPSGGLTSANKALWVFQPGRLIANKGIATWLIYKKSLMNYQH